MDTYGAKEHQWTEQHFEMWKKIPMKKFTKQNKNCKFNLSQLTWNELFKHLIVKAMKITQTNTTDSMQHFPTPAHGRHATTHILHQSSLQQV
jgi:hypothetical protein